MYTYSKKDIIYVDYPNDNLRKRNERKMGLSLEQLALYDYQYFRDFYIEIKDLSEKIKDRCYKIMTIGNSFVPKTKCEKCGSLGFGITIAKGKKKEYLNNNKNQNKVNEKTYTYRNSEKYHIYCSHSCFKDTEKIKLIGMSFESTLYDPIEYKNIMQDAIKNKNWKIFQKVKKDTNKLIRIIAEKGMGLELTEDIRKTDPLYFFEIFEKRLYEATIMENRYFPQFPSLYEQKNELIIKNKVKKKKQKDKKENKYPKKRTNSIKFSYCNNYNNKLLTDLPKKEDISGKKETKKKISSKKHNQRTLF